ncbi:mycofactocin system transcriptional regulator [Nocardioides aurantiacus]|uniref:TetR family transcriptional regulator n=1 Tax=Nocardioides aurantiacus TaxID=86796 RepID=A0A3N2CR67_9ACTN|nr:mycofactocin system transcriptional regulator [Nocardioides aurantiacus]ROR89754.1 TetR family transcriptional regulator [Nocardioides aurantiacus]
MVERSLSGATPARSSSSALGRPVATSHGAIERAAFRLFADHGFAGTTLDMIAAEVGVGRRTLFRYYRSKNDIPWGRFDRTLAGFRDTLAAMPDDLPVHEAVHRAVLSFNDFPDGAEPGHRERMRLILMTPELQAHSALRYAEWRAVIAEFVARRQGVGPHDLVPEVVSQVSLALALAAYELWLRRPEADLRGLLDDAMGGLRAHLAGSSPAGG